MERSKQIKNIIQGVAFDLEGTVINIESIHHNAHLKAAADHGINLNIREAIKNLSHFVGGPDEAVAKEIAILGNDIQIADTILESKRKHFNHLLKEQKHIQPREGFIAFFNWLKSLNIKVAIGTVSTRSLALNLIKQAGISNYFPEDKIVTFQDVSAPKPSPDVYLETALRMKISPRYQLVFEDSIIGLNAASGAGCRCVALPTVEDQVFIRLLEPLAEAVFYNWTDTKLYAFIRKIIK